MSEFKGIKGFIEVLTDMEDENLYTMIKIDNITHFDVDYIYLVNGEKIELLLSSYQEIKDMLTNQ